MAAPSAGPYAAPTSSTPSVCPVIGTGVNGSRNESCASPAMSRLPPTAHATWNATRAVARDRGRRQGQRERGHGRTSSVGSVERTSEVTARVG